MRTSRNVATLLLALIAWGSLALGTVRAQGASSALVSGRLGACLLVDFDGDHVPDLITTRVGVSHLTIEAYLTSKPGKFLVGTAERDPDARLVAVDIDGDGDDDLVLLGGNDQQPVAAWINDGTGGFTAAPVFSLPTSALPGTPLDAGRTLPLILRPTESTDARLGAMEPGARLDASPRLDRVCRGAPDALPVLLWTCLRLARGPPTAPPMPPSAGQAKVPEFKWSFAPHVTGGSAS